MPAESSSRKQYTTPIKGRPRRIVEELAAAGTPLTTLEIGTTLGLPSRVNSEITRLIALGVVEQVSPDGIDQRRRRRRRPQYPRYGLTPHGEAVHALGAARKATPGSAGAGDGQVVRTRTVISAIDQPGAGHETRRVVLARIGPVIVEVAFGCEQRTAARAPGPELHALAETLMPDESGDGRPRLLPVAMTLSQLRAAFGLTGNDLGALIGVEHHATVEKAERIYHDRWTPLVLLVMGFQSIVIETLDVPTRNAVRWGERYA